MNNNFSSIEKYLRFYRNANFYKNNNLQQKDINKALKDLKEGAFSNTGSQCGIIYDIVIFKCAKNNPSFATSDFPWSEQKIGFFFILRSNDYVAILKQNLNTPKEISEKIVPIDYKQLTKFHIQDNTKFKSVNMQNIDGQKTSVLSKSYIADDLTRNISGVDAGSFIIRSLRGELDKEKISISINSSRINQYGVRVGISEICSWAANTFSELDDLAGDNNENPFISNFAIQETYDGAGVPSYLLLHAEYLKSLFKDNPICEDDAHNKIDLYDYLSIFVESCRIKKSKSGEYSATYGQGKTKNLVKIELPQSDSANKRILLSNKKWNNIKIIDQCPDEFKGKTLQQIINGFNYFNLYFKRCSKVYSNGKLFYSSKLLNNADFFLQYISDKEMSGKIFSCEKWDNSLICTKNDSEEEKKIKNEKIKKMTHWDKNSLFAFVENKFGKSGSALFCDDLDDEWADFIEISDSGVTFFVCKYKHSVENSKAASIFQDVVGQAIKNLGNTIPTHGQLNRKSDKWLEKHDRTNIPRTKNKDDISSYVKKWENNMMNPSFKKTMCLVVNFLKKKDFISQINDLRASISSGKKTSKNDEFAFQKLWILSIFVNACRQVNVEPKIICQ